MTERTEARPQGRKHGFAVWVPDEALRPKLLRMAHGSMRSIGSTVATLISEADELAPEWRRRPQKSMDRPTDDPDLFRPETAQEAPHG